MISGVGPKIEGILHSLGIYTFAQVASWKKAEREWVDGYDKDRIFTNIYGVHDKG
jgi:NADH-quinone oxidoreductase subunit E